mmetsp:Transcript_289/g.369  ORF Transcript_289/g.369 Transcript_289/m.369 type:complete len:108 (+) Transcript_289:1061-1384(+)
MGKKKAQPSGDGKVKKGHSVHVRHILCEKQSKLLQAQERINNGEDFANVAREMSEDKARSGGDLGWIVRGKMVKEFEDIAFSLPIGGISRPFKTCHGWHLAKCEGVK